MMYANERTVKRLSLAIPRASRRNLACFQKARGRPGARAETPRRALTTECRPPQPRERRLLDRSLAEMPRIPEQTKTHAVQIRAQSPQCGLALAERSTCRQRNDGVTGDGAGAHVVLWPHKPYSEDFLVRKAAVAGVRIYGISRYFLGKPTRVGLMFGYARLREREIRGDIARIADLL